MIIYAGCLVVVVLLAVYWRASVTAYSKKGLSQYQTKLIHYFKEVCLETEYGVSPKRIIKWRNPIKIKPFYATKEQLQIIDHVIKQLNDLRLNDLRISITDEEKSNCQLYFCNMDTISKLNPGFYKIFKSHLNENDVHGYSSLMIDWSRHEIYNAYIYIDPYDSIEEQECTVLEEITQCLGIPNDSYLDRSSVFYQKKSEDSLTTNILSNLDKDVIQLLYHPEIKPGMNAKRVEKAIAQVLEKNTISLYGQ